MRHATVILFLAAVSVRADERPLTWEPARVLRLEEVVASDVLAPTDPHPAFFDFFSDAMLESDGSVVFIANGAGQGVSALGREGVYAIDRDGRPSILIQRGDSLRKGQTAVASVSALGMKDGVPVARCRLENGGEQTVVIDVDAARPDDSTTIVPEHPAVGIGKNGRSIYQSGREGTARIVADTATRIPELFEGTFTAFGERVVAFGPWVLFSGSADAYEGLFAMNTATDRLYLLLDNRAAIGGRIVQDFQISASPRSGADLAVTLSFAEGRSGIYIFRFCDGEGKPLFGGRGTTGLSPRGRES